jgi:indole-3-glycerol phosphate synthase
MPDGVVTVAESGIRDAADVERLAAVGYTAVLVGETLVRSADRSSAVDGLLGARA